MEAGGRQDPLFPVLWRRPCARNESENQNTRPRFIPGTLITAETAPCQAVNVCNAEETGALFSGGLQKTALSRCPAWQTALLLEKKKNHVFLQ